VLFLKGRNILEVANKKNAAHNIVCKVAQYVRKIENMATLAVSLWGIVCLIYLVLVDFPESGRGQWS
jgi:hypothetical protein